MDDGELWTDRHRQTDDRQTDSKFMRMPDFL